MPDINDDCVRIDTRLAGQIRRYHTWPITGQQTIAEHCWQILRIYLSVVDDVDPHMVYHIAFHDIGEHYTGDIPYPVKRDNPRLKGEMDFLEQKSQAAQMEYWGSFKQVVLSDYDKKLFKQIEMIEMAEFGIDQMLFGNNHGYIIANRCLQVVYSDTPCQRLAQYVMQRLKLFYRQCAMMDLYCVEYEWWSAEHWEKFNDSK